MRKRYLMILAFFMLLCSGCQSSIDEGKDKTQTDISEKSSEKENGEKEDLEEDTKTEWKEIDTSQKELKISLGDGTEIILTKISAGNL